MIEIENQSPEEIGNDLKTYMKWFKIYIIMATSFFIGGVILYELIKNWREGELMMLTGITLFVLISTYVNCMLQMKIIQYLKIKEK